MSLSGVRVLEEGVRLRAFWILRPVTSLLGADGVGKCLI